MNNNMNTKTKSPLFKKLNKIALFYLITVTLSSTPNIQSMKPSEDDFREEITNLRPELFSEDDYSSLLTPKKYNVPSLNLQRLQELPIPKEAEITSYNKTSNNSPYAIFQAVWQKKHKKLTKLLSDNNLKETFSTYQDDNGSLAFTTLKFAISQKKPFKYVKILVANIIYSKEQITEIIKDLTQYITYSENYRPIKEYLQNVLKEKTQK
ncbi:MAG: hypothetical protein ABH827_02330 [bacterium]